MGFMYAVIFLESRDGTIPVMIVCPSQGQYPTLSRPFLSEPILTGAPTEKVMV